ncbi:MAG: aminoglycoside phosphotransferase family protein [Pseudomonadota bacterium]
MDERGDRLREWADRVVRGRHGPGGHRIEPMGGDASFRRYFRLHLEQPPYQYLLMDAPPEQEDCRPFVLVAQRLLAHGVPAPAVLAADLDEGFLLLQDFGDALYLPALEQARQLHGPDGGTEAAALYDRALAALLRLQRLPVTDLPLYDRDALRREMGLFDEWFCAALLRHPVRGERRGELDAVYRLLEDSALAQPRVLVHRDYHSRNLMLRRQQPDGLPGVIDFQDAVCGPVTYDLVSLLRDCYIVWTPETVRSMALRYRDRLLEQGVVPEYSDERFLRDFDLMGLQRHLKVLGIFSRLYLRDGKPRYLGDLPAVMEYVRRVAAAHPSLQAFHDWFAGELMPLAEARLAERRP